MNGSKTGLVMRRLVTSLAKPNRWLLLTILVFALHRADATEAQSLSEKDLAKIIFDQKLNSQLNLDLLFQNEEGKPTPLREYFGKKPVLLVLGYYECPMLCTLVLNGLVEALQDMKWSIGQEFEVICVSISPSEHASLAAAKKRIYLKRYGRPGAAQGWHFLTGEEPPIRQLARQTGFNYAYDPVIKQYAHPSGFIVLTPGGKVAGYFFGVSHAPKEIHASLKAASSNEIGTPIQQLFFLCFHYSPIQGKYGALIMLLIRIAGGVTVLGVAGVIVSMIRRDRNSPLPKPECGSPTAVSIRSTAEAMEVK